MQVIWILVFIAGGVTNMEGPFTQDRCVELKAKQPQNAAAYCVNSTNLEQKIR